MEELRYSGNWEILGKEYFGNLIINDKKGIIRLILHNRDNLNSLFSNKDIPSKINFIKGNLIPYGVMSLLNATVISRNTNISYSTKTIELDIEYCINCDFKDYNNVKFSKMVFRLSNTLAWSGLNGISTDYQKHGSFILKHKFKKAITYSIDNNTTISFIPYFHENTNIYAHEEIIIKQFVKIQITSRTNQDLYFYIEILNKIKTLIEMSIAKNVDIREIIGYKRDYYRVFANRRMYNEIKIYSKDSYKDTYEELRINDMLFDLPSTINNKVPLFQNWFLKYELLKPILNLYNSSIIYEKMPVETIFLNIVQALETYHSRFICNKKEDYKRRVQDDILKDVPEELKKSHYEYLFDKTQQDKNTNYIILKSRLNDLMLANFDIIFFNMSNKAFPYDFVEKVVDTRHYFTHYSKSKENKIFKGKELLFAIEILRIVLSYYLLKEIGFEKEFVEKKIREMQTTLSYAWDLYKLEDN